MVLCKKNAFPSALFAFAAALLFAALSCSGPASRGDFRVISASPVEGGAVLVRFSSALPERGDLRGFITASRNGEPLPLTYDIRGREVLVYGDLRHGDFFAVAGLLDKAGRPLSSPFSYNVDNYYDIPAVFFAGSLSVLPTSQGVIVPIETVNLTAVIVEAYEISGLSMVQFLQQNDFSGTEDLYRVASPLWSAEISFPWSASDQNRKVRRGLDLSALSKAHPDSMLHLRVYFRRSHIRYEHIEEHPHADFSALFGGEEKVPPVPPPLGNSYDTRGWPWGREKPGPNYDRSYRDWNKDPCHPAFYEAYYDHDISLRRNILVSDTGLMAKKAADGAWYVAVTNLKTAGGVEKALVSILDYQGRTLAAARTDNGGIAVFSPAPSALASASFITTAVKNLGSAYLRLHEGNILATSHFDVSGVTDSTGIKAYLYTERGVWRPGDTIHTAAIIEETGSVPPLPPDYPVSFEIEDPRGAAVYTSGRTLGDALRGFYDFSYTTADNAPTGDYLARLRVGGAVFQKALRVETIAPNRLAVTIGLARGSSGASLPEVFTSEDEVTVDAAWLHGAPAALFKADAALVLSSADVRYRTHPGYVFSDSSRAVEGEFRTVFDGALDGRAHASFRVNVAHGRGLPGLLSARFIVRVYENSGAFSVENRTFTFSPYERYVGLRLPDGGEGLTAGVPQTVELALVDSGGNPVTDKVFINWALYRMDWRWWWERGRTERAAFDSALARKPSLTGITALEGGNSVFTLTVPPGDWGRYVLVAQDVRGGHAASASVFFDSPLRNGPGSAERDSPFTLLLSADKTEYAAGDPVTVEWMANRNARALVTIEKAGAVVRQDWVDCRDGPTRYSFKAEGAFAPNVYVHVTLLQPHLQTANDLPLRLYGILNINVSDRTSVIHPVISAPEEWSPASAAVFTVGEKSGRPMTFTVAVVDEGLLGLTGFRTADPQGFFFQKEGSVLAAYDMYSAVAGAFTGELETLLAVGGGEGLLENAPPPKRFPPVVAFFPPQSLGPGKTATLSFTPANYVGALRIMVIAASDDTPLSSGKTAKKRRAYGNAELTVPVRSAVMILPAVPRFLSPGDSAFIPGTVFLYEPSARDVEVTLDVQGAASLSGDAKVMAGFTTTGEKIVTFRVTAADTPGPAVFTFTASSGAFTASSTVSLDVRSAVHPVTKVITRRLSPGESWSGGTPFSGRSGTNTLALEFTRLPDLNLSSRLSYLTGYPHGCVEQTVSAVFPQLYLKGLVDVPEGKLRSNIGAAIDALSGFQTYDGGFSYWSGTSDEAHSWGTSYAGHFLLEAQRAGYTVNPVMISSWVTHQKNRAAAWPPQNVPKGADPYRGAFDQAYRLYTLSRARSPDIGGMNRLRALVTEGAVKSGAVRWRLAAAYWYAGLRDAALALRETASFNTAGNDEDETFGSEFRDKAFILETLNAMEDSGTAPALMAEIAAVLASDRWLSTQETAYALIAILPYLAADSGASPPTIGFTVSGVGAAAGGFSAAPGAASVSASALPSGDSALPLPSFTLGTAAEVTLHNAVAAFAPLPVNDGAASFTMVNRGSIPVFLRITTAGLPPETSRVQPLSAGLALSAAYTDPSGLSISPSNIPPGTDFLITLTVTNTGSLPLSHIALDHPLAANWEVLGRAAADGKNALDYRDIRDDRVLSYLTLGAGSSKTVVLRLATVYRGSYRVPPIRAYAMYDESIQALIPGE